MKRIIKFRVWDKISKAMYNGNENKGDYTMDFEGNCYCFSDPEQKESVNEDFILMQYTGIKDRNGVEIFEGDIIKNDKNLIVVVEWCLLDATFHCYDERHKHISTWTLGHFSTDNPSVIGNIHADPELIQAEQISG